MVLWGASTVALGTLILSNITDAPLEDILFDVISGFATVGLSTGVTANLPDSGVYVMAAIMFMGRVGTVTLAAALAGQLDRLDREVLAVDADMGLVQKWSERITHAVQADVTKIEALEQIGARDFRIAIVKLNPTRILAGKTLTDSGVRGTSRVTVVGVKKAEQSFTFATAETLIDATDEILVSGHPSDIERFAALPK